MMKKVLFCAGLLLAGSLFAADYTREEYTSLMEIGKRPRRTPHTLIFARFQPYFVTFLRFDTVNRLTS